MDQKLRNFRGEKRKNSPKKYLKIQKGTGTNWGQIGGTNWKKKPILSVSKKGQIGKCPNVPKT